MTSQTRALIEALEKAEQLASIASDWNLDEVEIDGVMTRTVELEKYFRAAISSAKAAEEGVETAWRMVNKHRPLGSGPMFETEAEARACFDMPYNHKNYPRLERLDTYTTVISVREKEGL